MTRGIPIVKTIAFEIWWINEKAKPEIYIPKVWANSKPALTG